MNPGCGEDSLDKWWESVQREGITSQNRDRECSQHTAGEYTHLSAEHTHTDTHTPVI